MSHKKNGDVVSLKTNVKKVFYYSLLIIASVIFLGMIYQTYIYKTPEEKLLSKAEKELLKSMNDPDSYELIDFKEDWEKQIEHEREMDELDMKDYSANKKFYKLTFRGTNKMGALIIDEVYVEASKDDLLFIGLVD